ncbi:hypothetical protein BDZ91DRAFT_747686 [Kalaharituber pfeilii]|nr:hypothetical protein BDZ91DRAFT_747686 [Kalaharituber pfeilii]
MRVVVSVFCAVRGGAAAKVGTFLLCQEGKEGIDNGQGLATAGKGAEAQGEGSQSIMACAMRAGTGEMCKDIY